MILTVCDATYATVVVGLTGLAAVMYWTVSGSSGPPLVLVDWTRAPFTPLIWSAIDQRLTELAIERRARIGSLGAFTEEAHLARLGEVAGCAVASLPEHLQKPDAWAPMCQAAAMHMGMDRVTIARAAMLKMNEPDPLGDPAPASFRAVMSAQFGPRDEEDPSVAAFVFGIVLGLDETLARSSKRKPAKVNSNRAKA